MPLYEYECEKCGHQFEELVSFAEADKVACEQCGSKRTQRMASEFSSQGGSDIDPAPACGMGG